MSEPLEKCIEGVCQMSVTDPRARLGRMLSAALHISTFGDSALVGAKTRQELVGDACDFTHLELNILAKELIVACQVEMIKANGSDDLRKLLGVLVLNPLHFAKEKAVRLKHLHAAQLEAVPLRGIVQILKDQGIHHQRIRELRSRSNETRPQAELPGQR